MLYVSLLRSDSSLAGLEKLLGGTESVNVKLVNLQLCAGENVFKDVKLLGCKSRHSRLCKFLSVVAIDAVGLE